MWAWINIGIMAGWSIVYIPIAILEAKYFKDRKAAKLSMLCWLISVGIQGICLCLTLLVEKFG